MTEIHFNNERLSSFLEYRRSSCKILSVWKYDQRGEALEDACDPENTRWGKSACGMSIWP